ncbi:ASKHA domain-containing protein [Clostridiaceae bacterium 35-E11]
MTMVSTLRIQCNKEKVLKALHCSQSSLIYDRMNEMYDEMFKKAQLLVDMRGSFQFMSNEATKTLCDQYEYYVPCLLTLGEKISEEVTLLFQKNEPLRAMMLDGIADHILFDASNQLFQVISKDAEEMKVNLTQRFSPGDQPNTPITFQQDILESFSKEANLGITITEAYMLKPVKSLAYFYGADKNLGKATKDHSCSQCQNLSCQFRSEERIKIDIISNQQKQSVYGTKGQSLLDILREHKISIDAPCNGTGRCGKCKIRALNHRLEVTNEDEKCLSEEALKKGIRLACHAYPQSDLTIELEHHNTSYSILTDYAHKSFELNPRVEIFTTDGILENATGEKSLTERINEQFHKNFHYSLKALQSLGKINKTNQIHLITQNNYVLGITEKLQQESYGIGIDIGTTTIAMMLVDLRKGKIIGSYAVLNPQRPFGGDVISRIHYSTSHDDQQLATVLRNCIERGIEELCSSISIDLEDIHHIGIVGNTTMLYFLLGLPTQNLSQSPFTTIVLDQQMYDYTEIFEKDLLHCKVTLLPCVSAYIGADIVSGMFNYGFNDLEETILFVDIGTNGEITLGNGEKIYCASTAAGPAFEGANIIDGIGSVDGAISKVFIKQDKIAYETIHNGKPAGICGSGVVDIVAVGLDQHWIDHTGRLKLENTEDHILISKTKDKAIKFYQKDIREVQLAKSAIRTGIDILINRFDCCYNDIDHVLIAGGFGNKINIENAIRIGLIPKELKNKISLVGNSALRGVIQYLLNKDADKKIYEIKRKVKHFELANAKEFQEKYILNMGF